MIVPVSNILGNFMSAKLADILVYHLQDPVRPGNPAENVYMRRQGLKSTPRDAELQNEILYATWSSIA